MPRLWTDTIEAHRREVNTAILDAGAALAAERGLRSVTMSHIAEHAGIGRATLYKYYPDVETILAAWHERQVTAHLALLAQVATRTDDPYQRLEAALEAYAFIQHDVRQARNSELGARLHGAEHVARAEQQLRDLLGNLIAAAAAAGQIRGDVAAGELTAFSMHALAAATGLPSKAAVRRLVRVTLAGMAPPAGAVG
jgi:AcrR family transcriptional regulator